MPSKLLACLLLVLVTWGAEAQESKLRFSSQLPPTSPISKGMEQWKAQLEEAGKGRLKVETYYNSQLYKDSEIFSAIQSGSVDMGLVIVGQLSAYDPIFGIFDLPGLFHSYEQTGKALKGDLGKIFAERLEKLGVVPLYWPVQGFVEIATTGRDLKSVADFKGLKLRTHSKELARMAQLIGAAPTVIAPSEVSTALSRKTIDGLTATLSSYYQRKWFEAAPHATLSRFGLVVVVIAMNKQAFEKLPAEIKAAARAASQTAEARSIDDTVKEEADVVEKLKAAKVVMSSFDAKAHEEFQKITAPMYDEYIKAAGPAGKALVDFVRSVK